MEFCFRCIKFELPILQPSVWVWNHLIESDALRNKNRIEKGLTQGTEPCGSVIITGREKEEAAKKAKEE